MLTMDYVNIEEGLEELKRGIDVRNKMGGALYWNVLNDECLKLADKLVSDGADRNKIAEIGGWELRY